MSERHILLIIAVLFFAFLAKDISVPAVVLGGLAVLRWLGMNDLSFRSMKGAGR